MSVWLDRVLVNGKAKLTVLLVALVHYGLLELLLDLVEHLDGLLLRLVGWTQVDGLGCGLNTWLAR